MSTNCFRSALLTIVITLSLVAPAMAVDKVKLTKGVTVNGTIEKMTPQEVSVTRPGGGVEKIAVNEIESIGFDAEPPQMNAARTAAHGGRYEDVLKTLEKLADNADTLSPNVKQDVQYFQAYATARLALTGSGDVRVAGQQMRDFVQKNASSYHLLEAHELLGDLLTALDKHDAAQQQYETVEKGAPWNDVKMRARIAKAHALRSQGKSDLALKEFESALGLVTGEKTPAVEVQRQAATLGKAACLADAKQYDEAVTLVESIIATADPEQAELHARAFNTLGTCLKKAGKNKAAVNAFLHVDLLYPTIPQSHAEALKNLVELFPTIGDPQRAVQAQETLKTRYPNSQWAKG